MTEPLSKDEARASTPSPSARGTSYAERLTLSGTRSEESTRTSQERPEGSGSCSSSAIFSRGPQPLPVLSQPFHERRRKTVEVARVIQNMVRAMRRQVMNKHQSWTSDQFNGSIVSDDGSLEPVGNRYLDSLISRDAPQQESTEVLPLLQNTEHLHALKREEMELVMSASLRREYLPGEVVVHEGEIMPHVGIILWGQVEAFVPTRWGEPHGKHWNHNRRRRSAYVPEVNSDAEELLVHYGTMKTGMVFGFDGCVFEEASTVRIVAGTCKTKVVVLFIPYLLVRKLLTQNPYFSQSVGRHIMEEDIFIPVREFCRYVFSPITAKNEYLPLWTILEKYAKIDNVIHTKLSSRELDTAAWGYALKRLPENVTTTFCFDLVLALPPFVATRMREEAKLADVRHQLERRGSSRTSVKYIRTSERRRCTWLLGMEGKTLVLLRDGYTDLLDFLSMLSVHIVESNKLRGRVQGMAHPPAIDLLDEYLRQREEERMMNKELSSEEELKRVQSILAKMPLTQSEQSGILSNWHTSSLEKIYEVMMHREEFNVRVDSSISRKFQLNPFHEWALNLRACVLEKLYLDRDSPLPDDLIIDVVSSNTHCIKNLLSGFHRKQWNAFEEHVRGAKGVSDVSQWYHLEDVFYSATPGFLSHARPDLKDEYVRSLEESGITVLKDTAMTGLQVDVIPVHALNFENIDTVLQKSMKDHIGESKMAMWRNVCQPRRKTKGANSRNNSGTEGDCYRLRQHVIINMDFAFGAQAEGICRAIFSAFGHRIRSVNVMGKAGGLVGKRGDIQLPTHVLLSKSSLIVEDTQDELRRCRNQGFTAERLRELVGPSVKVHEGKILTIAGTLLQNKRMLRFYKHVMGCVGAEMEGSYFARVIEGCYRVGISHKDIVSRFAYYTSDLPLGASEESNGTGGASLSAPMTPLEGVPPLYAIARGIIEQIIISTHATEIKS